MFTWGHGGHMVRVAFPGMAHPTAERSNGASRELCPSLKAREEVNFRLILSH